MVSAKIKKGIDRGERRAEVLKLNSFKPWELSNVIK